MNETEFECKLIDRLSGGLKSKSFVYEKEENDKLNKEKKNLIYKASKGTEPSLVSDGLDTYLSNTSDLWTYMPNIKTTEDLWQNFKAILESHNPGALDNKKLSDSEFENVKREICKLSTPYEAGQFLFGMNGVCQIQFYLDTGKFVTLEVFNQDKIAGGNTVYQVVNQIERPSKIPGKKDRRFDTTLLINGLPIVQIEEKVAAIPADFALNQMHQYIIENQYSDIFSTVQLLVAMTPVECKYMANTTADKFNKDFSFYWKDKDNKPVNDWKKFSDALLTIPMAHQMSTNYMILDGTKNKESLKVMRSYQVYATQEAIEKIRKTHFDMGDNKLGYIWHTTGSGKTITSFKTAWLANRLPNVDKVVFVVDRIALTKQTVDSYMAYDPNFETSELEIYGSISDTKNTGALKKQLEKKGGGIIITSVQKLQTLVKRKSFKAPNKNILFIVDEAHRSTGGEGFDMVQKAFPKGAWLGYTGTPMFDKTTKGLRTEDIFGKLLHAYTIRDAIADKNVLGFKVDFQTTIDETEMKEKYLPSFYANRYPDWQDWQIKNKIDNMTIEDMDDEIEPSFYDENIDHIKLVVEDIFKNWRNRSNDGKYNALLTTHVGGNKASIPMAIMYYDEIQRVNKERKSQNLPTLKVAITFSLNTTNNDVMVNTNESLERIIDSYNKEFGTEFDMTTVNLYTEDVATRLKKASHDDNNLDLVIVVDQLLTGFDAPQMNTLYVDRTLKGAGLIQAYSRTNRVHNMQDKPWGRVINYRWPKQNEKLMNDALAIYAEKSSADLKKKIVDPVEPGIIAEKFKTIFGEVSKIVSRLDNLTDSFVDTPPLEKDKEEMYHLLMKYNIGMAKLKQYDPEKDESGESIGFDYDRPDDLIYALGMTPDQEQTLTTHLSKKLRKELADIKEVPIYQLELKMTHIKEIRVNYDYLNELVADLLNEVHENKIEEAKETRKNIERFTDTLVDRKRAKEINDAADAIVNGEYPTPDMNFKYPAEPGVATKVIKEASIVNVDKKLLDFRIKWGIVDLISPSDIRDLVMNHELGENDLNDGNQVSEILKKSVKIYGEMAYDKEVKEMSRSRYRTSFKEALLNLADEIVGE